MLSTLPAFITLNTHGRNKTPCRTPNFFGFRTRPGRVRPDGPRRPAVLPPNHASARPGFLSAPSLGLEHDFGRIAASLSKRCRPAAERGP